MSDNATLPDMMRGGRGRRFDADNPPSSAGQLAEAVIRDGGRRGAVRFSLFCRRTFSALAKIGRKPDGCRPSSIDPRYFGILLTKHKQMNKIAWIDP
jgi:hypothetical protein